ncbi:MAG: GbsR/MarR family transcriptional regulator [Planctomycetota bacterium]
MSDRLEVSPPPTAGPVAPPGEFQGLDAPLQAELPTFELFFKTFGFKRVHGRVWGLLVLAGQRLSSRDISRVLRLSQGATSTALNELTAWGAIQSEFDADRRCHLHSPVGNTLSIVATVFRRREQVVMGRLKQTAQSTLGYVRREYGPRDPRVITLRSIISSLEIADAVMQLVFSSVERALGDSQSILSKAVGTALKIGMRGAGKRGKLAKHDALAAGVLASLPDDDEELADDDAEDAELANG